MSFLQRLFKLRTKHVNISIVGLDKAGKTTIVKYLLAGEHKETVPTFGVNREVIDLPKLKMDIFDLGGQEDFRGLWGEVNEKSEGVIYVVDSTDFPRLEETKQIFHNVVSRQIEKFIPVMILLNKSDLPDHMPRPDFIQEFDLLKLTDIKWACFETSAITGEGIYQAFKWFIDCFLEE